MLDLLSLEIIFRMFFNLALLYMCFRLLQILSRGMDIWNKEISTLVKDKRPDINQTLSYTTSGLRSESKKVEDLPPEVLAPMLRKPPMSPGGFGSKVKDK